MQMVDAQVIIREVIDHTGMVLEEEVAVLLAPVQIGNTQVMVLMVRDLITHLITDQMEGIHMYLHSNLNLTKAAVETTTAIIASLLHPLVSNTIPHVIILSLISQRGKGETATDIKPTAMELDNLARIKSDTLL
jgi:hypothetical protein